MIFSICSTNSRALCLCGSLSEFKTMGLHWSRYRVISHGVSLDVRLNPSLECYANSFWVLEVVSLLGSDEKDGTHGKEGRKSLEFCIGNQCFVLLPWQV